MDLRSVRRKPACVIDPIAFSVADPRCSRTERYQAREPQTDKDGPARLRAVESGSRLPFTDTKTSHRFPGAGGLIAHEVCIECFLHVQSQSGGILRGACQATPTSCLAFIYRRILYMDGSPYRKRAVRSFSEDSPRISKRVYQKLPPTFRIAPGRRAIRTEYLILG